MPWSLRHVFESSGEIAMQCPKCQGSMQPKRVEVLHGRIEIDRCEQCHGLWFDAGEADSLKDEWMSEFVDSGDPAEGKRYNRIRDINCPHCGKKMAQLNDQKQPHIEYEACPEHGMFMDAGEFTDYKHETLADWFRSLIKGSR